MLLGAVAFLFTTNPSQIVLFCSGFTLGLLFVHLVKWWLDAHPPSSV